MAAMTAAPTCTHGGSRSSRAATTCPPTPPADRARARVGILFFCVCVCARTPAPAPAPMPPVALDLDGCLWDTPFFRAQVAEREASAADLEASVRTLLKHAQGYYELANGTPAPVRVCIGAWHPVDLTPCTHAHTRTQPFRPRRTCLRTSWAGWPARSARPRTPSWVRAPLLCVPLPASTQSRTHRRRRTVQRRQRRGWRS
jgi:hypothetical protein